MIIKVVIVLGIYALIVFSGYKLYNMLHLHGSELQEQNLVKFQLLFYIHILSAIFLAVLIKLENFYHSILCAFFVFLAIFLAMFVCEATVQGGPPEEELLNETERGEFKLEKIFHDIYYLVYMYSIMGLALTGMFIFVSEGMAYWQSPPVTRYDAVIDFLPYNDSMCDSECPICLSEFAKDGQYSRIKKCGHVFHEACLRQWLKYNKICPLDRATIF